MVCQFPRLRSTTADRPRQRTIEHLERRDMLTGSPTVLSVGVASTAWTPAFYSYLQNNGMGSNGYTIPEGSSAQSATLTWTNIDQIVITFDQDVNVDAADLSVSGINQTSYAFGRFHYDPQAHTAIWTLTAPLSKDRVRLDLDANGADAVSGLDGTLLDGEWTNNVSTASGNGTAGGDFQFNFNVLPTDVNNTGTVNSYDYVYIRQLDAKSTTSVGYVAKRDVDGNGVINLSDWQEALNRAYDALPGGSAAGTYNDAPTTAGFDLLAITDTELDYAISLLSSFDDLESGPSGLTYSIIFNDNPALFDGLSIDPSTDALVVNAASGTSGRAQITVRATDAGGLSVDTVITVDVNYENQPPLITGLFMGCVGANTWIISGDVIDSDDDVSNFIVQFSGVFEIRAATDQYGHFEFAVILEEGQSGVEYAITYDPHGYASNEPFGEVGWQT
jgi:hypothetical protein